MNNINDKDQYSFQINCATCLSVGRKMYSLKIYLDIFESIMSKVLESDKKYISRNNICWECLSLLRNVRRFQKKASKAHKLLENKHMRNSSLSTLCTETINETIEYDSSNNTQPFNTIIVTQIKDEIKKVKDETEILKNNSDQETEQYFDEISVDLSKKKVNHKKTKSKWALKHSLLKRKPKFKSFRNSNNIEFNFTRIQLSEIEILNSIYAKDNENSFGKNNSTCSSINTDDCIKKHKMTVIGTLGEHFICDICNAKIKTKCNLIRHVTDHYYKYECKWCQYVGYRKDKVKEHLEMHKKLIKCLRCGIVCGSSQELSVHYRDLHETYTCHYCGVTFKMRYCIKDHIRRKHSAFKCKTCSKEFKRYNALWLHNKICHSVVQTKAYCNVCDKHFVDIYRYKWHLANSVQHKPRKQVKVPCPDCEKVFTKNIYMKDHYNLVHLKLFKYRCEDCDKNFIRNADLLKHKRRVHEGILPPKDKICHHCGRGFTTHKILGNHLRTHAKSTEKKLLI